MTHPSRNAKRKMFRRKMWAVEWTDGPPQFLTRRDVAMGMLTAWPNTIRRVFPVEVREITEIPPKPKRSKKVNHGK